MTAGRRPEDAGEGVPYARQAYGADGAFLAAVDGLADPLNDPLPGRDASPWTPAGAVPDAPPPGTPGLLGPAGFPGPAAQAHGGPGPGPADAAPWQGPVRDGRQRGGQGLQQPLEGPSEWYAPEGYRRDWYGPQQPSEPVPPPDLQDDPRTEVLAPVPAEPRTEILRPVGGEAGAGRPAYEDARKARPEPPGHTGPPPPGGRAERRRAAKGRGRRRTGPAAAAPAAPMSRVEARRAARAAKDSPAVVASRVAGEVFISLGVLMLLFVAYQLWWTNVRAEQIAGRETSRIQDGWADGERSPGAFEPGQGFAIMHIPKLDVVAPIAEGIDKEKVLDRGMIGHYGEGSLKTAMPSDEQGNFSVAGHRNTHGEPFRYINKLSPGDPIVVETQDAYYTYEMASILPQTPPSNIAVIAPVPAGSGFTEPGRYITLTTCTPEFTSTYRLIVWGKMVDERPRSEGKPDALVG
ncbi:class E sortase [Streptomyces pratensis]|uniref:class E sortase n=1 Tax=Streptomyces pratensis TaxID=1169025 RepID=UPI00301621DC